MTRRLLIAGALLLLLVSSAFVYDNRIEDPAEAHAVIAKPLRGKPCGTRQTPPAGYRHVVWIWFENKPYSQVIGSRSAPFMNALVRSCGLATNYHGVAHPSLPNYLAATSGSTNGITSDCPPTACGSAARSLFSETSWVAYQESMPRSCARSDAYPYRMKHNPPLYYRDLTSCETNDVPLTTSIRAAFTFITPNMCHDMHDCSVKQGDAWLSNYLPALLRSPSYKAGDTAIFITWDEDDYKNSNRVPLIVASPSIRPGLRVRGRYDHYSLLRTTQNLLGVACLAASCSARSMQGPFRLSRG